MKLLKKWSIMGTVDIQWSPLIFLILVIGHLIGNKLQMANYLLK